MRSSRITRSTPRAAAASPAEPSTDPVDRLPAALAQAIFLFLSLHERIRCREVSRAWRAALADGGCWRKLCFSGCQDLPWVRCRPYAAERLILAAGRAAGGAAEEIDARGLHCGYEMIHTCLKRIAEENGGSLRVLRFLGTDMCIPAAQRPDCESVPSWLGSGKLPHLEELEADVRADSVDEARRLLDDARQPDGRFKALRIRMLDIHADGVSFSGEYENLQKEREVGKSLAEFLRTAAPAHPSLTGLTLVNMPLLHPGLIDSVASAAVACGLESLHLEGPHINHTCLPALSRALRSGRLRSLVLYDDSFCFDASASARALDGPRNTHAEFCAALRESRLERLELRGLRMWDDPDNGRALLAALTAHPTLRRLDISGYQSGGAESTDAAADAISALLESNKPALQSLRISFCGLDAEHLERILGALRVKTQLTALDCTQRPGRGGWVDEAFAKRVVLPLVQANTTLRALRWDSRECGAVGEEIDKIMGARMHCAGLSVPCTGDIVEVPANGGG